MAELGEWDNFYVVVGSAAGALIGLQFVVMTLIADMPGSRGDAQAGGAFATPSVVHFGTGHSRLLRDNAWDAITYHVFIRGKRQQRNEHSR